MPPHGTGVSAAIEHGIAPGFCTSFPTTSDACVTRQGKLAVLMWAPTWQSKRMLTRFPGGNDWFVKAKSTSIVSSIPFGSVSMSRESRNGLNGVRFVTRDGSTKLVDGMFGRLVVPG